MKWLGAALVVLLAVVACASPPPSSPSEPTASPGQLPSGTPPIETVSCEPYDGLLPSGIERDSCPSVIAAVRAAIGPLNLRIARIAIEPGGFVCGDPWPRPGSSTACASPGPSILAGTTMHGWVTFDGSAKVAALALSRDLPVGGASPASSPIWSATIVALTVPPAGWTMPAEARAPTTPFPTAALYFVADEVLWAGTPSTFAIGAQVSGSKVAVAQATIDFGDGNAPLSGSAPCASGANRVALQHAYPAAGRFTASITAATLCDPVGALDLSEVARVLVLPAAIGVPATWPRCTTFQLHMSGVDHGSSLSNGGALFLLENVSASGCTLDGYPSVQLVAASGALMPTLVTQATTGDYLFPTIGPGLVALAPGGYAVFEAGYADVPFGSMANATAEVACPVARWVRIILPATNQFGTAETAIAPCDGWLNVSAIFPGRDWITFQ